MTRPIVTALCLAALVAGCGGGSRLNPLNWFGGSREVATQTAADPGAATGETRPLVQQITALSIERTPGGAILHVTGLPPTQGYWEADLVPDDPYLRPQDGVLSYQFRAHRPPAPTRVSTPQSRYLEVGTFLSSQALAGVREIRVNAATNARVARR